MRNFYSFDHKPSFLDVSKAVLEVSGVSFKEMIEGSSTKRIVNAKAIFAFAMKEYCGATIPDIAEVLEMDASSISYLLNKVKKSNPNLRMIKSEVRERVFFHADEDRQYTMTFN